MCQDVFDCLLTIKEVEMTPSKRKAACVLVWTTSGRYVEWGACALSIQDVALLKRGLCQLIEICGSLAFIKRSIVSKPIKYTQLLLRRLLSRSAEKATLRVEVMNVSPSLCVSVCARVFLWNRGPSVQRNFVAFKKEMLRKINAKATE